ncbi:MAG: hypothetical protein NTW04_05095, partial [Elusimicrobia bacterium]|nr:hypothetical protein [Elusimicrobiota bacterium]
MNRQIFLSLTVFLAALFSSIGASNAISTKTLDPLLKDTTDYKTNFYNALTQSFAETFEAEMVADQDFIENIIMPLVNITDKQDFKLPEVLNLGMSENIDLRKNPITAVAFYYSIEANGIYVCEEFVKLIGNYCGAKCEKIEEQKQLLS